MSSVKGFNTSIGVQRYDYESLDDKLEKSAITEVFDPAKSYAAGDTAIHQGKLYKRKTAGSGAWNAADWDLTSVLEVAANAEEVAGEIAGLKEDLDDISVEENIASSVIDTSGSGANVDRRYLSNKIPVPSGCIIKKVCYIPNNGSSATKGKIEFATKSGDTYTIYASKTFNFTSSTTNELVNFLSESVRAVGDTYVFICLDSDSTGKVRINVSTGKRNQYTTDVSSSSFTLITAASGYEIAYEIYYNAVIGQADANLRINTIESEINDIATIRSNASKVNNYPFSPDATLKVGNVDFTGLKNAIKDIRLFGADINDDYWIYTYLVNYEVSGTYSVEVRRASDNKNVCGFSTTSIETGFNIYCLNEQSNSGIFGEIVWNPSAFTTSYYFGQAEYTKIAKECVVVKNEYDMKYLIENVMCIGDSLTQGYIKSTGESYYHTKDSYPSILKKICNAENVLNRGASGFTASNYYSQNIVGHSSWYPFTDYDYVIVWLGTNLGLDTEEQQTAYDNIISAIQTGNANAKIFLCTCFTTTGTSLSDTNAYIRSKNLPVIDMNIAPFNLSSDSNMHPYDVTHFGDVGYQMVAEHIVSEISKYIETHMSEFNRIGRPVT